MLKSLGLGVVVLVSALVALAVPAFAADSVWWGNYAGPYTIAHANLDGSGGGVTLTMTGATVNNPYGETIDAAAGKIYWANNGDNVISVANLDGTGAHDLPINPADVQTPGGVAVDPAAGKLYWGNDGGTSIGYANLDGSGAGLLNTSGATTSDPNGVAIDPATNKIYWANQTDKTHPISFANLDNTGGGGDLDVTGTTSNSPTGVAIDPATNKIYWADQTSHINFASLDNTSGGGALNTSGATASSTQAVAVDPISGRVYWADFSAGISYANADDSGAGGDLSTSGAAVNGAVYPVILRAPSPAGAPVITGGSSAGSALSCSTGTWGADFLGSLLYRAPQSFSYAWTLNGAPVGGTGPTLTATAVGSYACRVTATNFAGSATSQASAAVAVTGRPSVTISSPASGRTYRRGQSVRTTFACVEGIGGPGLAACTDSHGASGPHGRLGTGAVGKHTYTVTAVSKGGARVSASITYKVVGLSIKSGRAAVKKGKAKLKLACAGARGSACTGRMTLTVREKVKGHTRNVVVGSGRFTVAAGKRRTVTVKLKALGLSLIAGANNRLKVTATVVINGGRAARRSVTLT